MTDASPAGRLSQDGDGQQVLPGRAADFLAGGAAMGAAMRAKDWSRTPLGEPATWPQSLRTSVSTCLNCAFPILVWWGPDLVMLYNDAYRAILGAKHPRSLGAAGRDVWPEIWDVIGPMLDRVLGQGEATRAEDLLLMLHRHGYPEECYFSFSYSPIRDETGGVGGVFCPVIEMTERVVGERRLRVLRRLAEQTANRHSASEACTVAASCLAEGAAQDLPFVAFYLLDPDGATARLSGASCTTGGSLAFPDIVHLDFPDASPWPLRAVIDNRADIVVETTGTLLADLPTGPWQRAPVEAVAVPLGSGTSRPFGVMVAGLNPHRPAQEVRDLADLAARHVAIAIGNAEAYEAERRRAQALAEIDRAKTAFFSNVSHEFRTPLTLTIGPLEDALNDAFVGGMAAPQRERLETAHRNALRLLRLVNTLLDFSRIESGRASANYRPTDLATLTADIASSFRSAVEQAGLALRIDCAPLAQPVHVDTDMWEKVVLNLLSNAFKFTFDGEIAVTLRTEDGNAVLRVRDTGVGIPPHELPHLFERFHRIEGQRGRSFEGSGIGLALVQELINLHGGSITAESGPDRGSTFTVAIPFGTAHLPQDRLGTAPASSATAARADAFVEEALRWLPDAPADASTVSPAAASSAAHRPTLLLADDNADMRDYIRRLLKDEYEVVAVADGRAALDAIRHHRPDMVLSDLMMPGLSGLELLHAIRTDVSLRDLPVVLLSARAGEEARIEGVEGGADGYLTKPFSAQELRAQIRAHLALAQRRREAVQDLAESEATLRALYEASPLMMGTVELRDDGDVLHIYDNPASCRLFGVASDSTMVRSARGLGASDSALGYWRDHFEKSAARGMPMTFEYERPARGDDAGAGPRALAVTVAPLPPMRAGGRRRFCYVAEDVTERRIAERALAEANTRLEERVTERTRALGDLARELIAEMRRREEAQAALLQAQKLEALGQLTGGMAHDFNNILCAIIGSYSLIRRRADAPKVLDVVSLGEDAAKRGVALIAQLMAFARKEELRPRVLDIAAAVRGTKDMLCHTIGSAVACKLRICADVWPVIADPVRLETVLLNLAANSRDAMQDGGRLIISLRNAIAADLPHDLDASRDWVRVAVDDTGEGMDAETLRRATEPFFTTKPPGKGTGLGLASAQGFASQSGGVLRLRSAPGEGCTVELFLPRAAVEAVAVAPDDNAAMPRREEHGRATILLVDDDDGVRLVTADMLRDFGYTVIEAASAEAAEALAVAGGVIDLLVTDVLMSGVAGPVLAKRLREERPDLPVLFITAHAAGIGLDDAPVLRKPFTDRSLAAAIMDCLGRERCMETGAAGQD